MNKICMLMIAVLMLSVSSAAAETKMQTFTSGSKLQMDCSGLGAPFKNETKMLLDATCLNYIKGVFDLHQTLVGGRMMEPRFCKPENTDLGQLARTIIRYIEENQEKADVTASSLIMHALEREFPCPPGALPSR